MTNGTIPERGEVEWTVAGTTYVLALPLRQLRALDKELSCGGVLRLMAPGTKGIFDAQIEDVALILRYGFVGGGHDLKTIDLEALWDKCGMMEAITICDSLLQATLRGATKPTKAEPQGDTKDPLPPGSPPDS